MENDETDIIDHIVEIDSHISATLKIPVRLSAIELKALMVKANKLFNLSETPLMDIQKRTYQKRTHRDDAEKKLATLRILNIDIH